MRRFLLVTLLGLWSFPGAHGEGVVEADGVSMDGEGNPFYSTFSLCAIDPETGEAGVAVTTRVPFVGRAVPWVRAGVGAVATQSWTVVEYGVRGAMRTRPELPGKKKRDAEGAILWDDQCVYISRDRRLTPPRQKVT
jgi:hypothetical protein